MALRQEHRVRIAGRGFAPRVLFDKAVRPSGTTVFGGVAAQGPRGRD